MTKKLLSVYLTGLFILFSGCFSASMMQTARPTEKGENQYSLGLSGYGFYGAGPEFMFRRGLSDRSDFGVAYSVGLYGHLRMDYKHCLWQSEDQNSFFSTGLGADVYLPNDFSGFYPIIGFTLPLYYSFNHDGAWTPYFAQRLTVDLHDAGIASVYSNNKPMRNYNFEHTMVYSGAAGVQWHRPRTSLFLEFVYTCTMEHVYNAYRYSPDYDWYLDRSKYRYSSPQLTFGIMLPRRKSRAD